MEKVVAAYNRVSRKVYSTGCLKANRKDAYNEKKLGTDWRLILTRLGSLSAIDTVRQQLLPVVT